MTFLTELSAWLAARMEIPFNFFTHRYTVEDADDTGDGNKDFCVQTSHW